MFFPKKKLVVTKTQRSRRGEVSVHNAVASAGKSK